MFLHIPPVRDILDMRSFLVVLCAMYLDICSVSGESYSALTHLKAFAAKETDLYTAIDSYWHSERQRLDKLKIAFADLKARSPHLRATETKTLRMRGQAVHLSPDHLKPTPEELNIVGHPIEAFHIISKWHKICQAASVEAPDRDNKLYDFLRDTKVSFPMAADLNGAANALWRLWRTYKLNATELVDGSIGGVRATRPMDRIGILQLSTIVREKDFQVPKATLEYYKATILKTEQPGVQVSETTYSRVLRSLELLSENETASKVRELAERETLQPEPLLELLQTVNLTEDTRNNSQVDEEELYNRLCRREVKRPASETLHLSCRYTPTVLPYVLYKEERLSLQPRVSVFYDFISDKEAEFIKEVSKASLYRATTGDMTQKVISEIRVSQVTWMWDHALVMIKSLSKRVQLLTGLDTTHRDHFSSAEPFQVVNYGLGGHYYAHMDYYDDPTKLDNVPAFLQKTGDRIATFLMYLSDVKAGGHTVFTKLKIGIPPVKNSAAFWYNLRRSGKGDPDTRHASCPVLLGEKWIANKWLREYGQEFRRPCGRSPDATDADYD